LPYLDPDVQFLKLIHYHVAAEPKLNIAYNDNYKSLRKTKEKVHVHQN